MATNINIELFKKYAPKKKIEIIHLLTKEELLLTDSLTIARIVKEAGVCFYKSRDKYLYIDREIQKGNDWNSSVEKVEVRKGICYINFYVQGDDTDTNISETYSNFARQCNYKGRCFFPNRYGDNVPCYFLYSIEDKANVIRSILLQYVYTRYRRV